MRPVAGLRGAVAAVLALGVLVPSTSQAQIPARFYWKSLSDANAVPLIVMSDSGNTNPCDPAHVLSPDASFEATLALTGYARTFTLFDRSAMAALLLTMGRVSSEVSSGGGTQRQTTDGYGDPMIEFTVNLLGPPAQENIPDVLRYEPGLSVDLLVDVAIPVGEYDSSQALNIGQHRWYGRVGAPVVWQLGAWVPGQRTTLEFLPSLWLYGANDNFVGETLTTDPKFQLDAHVTRDLTESFWGSIDATWFYGGKSSVDGVEGEKLNDIGVGITLGYQISDNLNLTIGYKSTVNDQSPGDLKMNQFVISLVFGWHPLIEGMQRLKSEH
jgi:hypothetical protein